VDAPEGAPGGPTRRGRPLAGVATDLALALTVSLPSPCVHRMGNRGRARMAAAITLPCVGREPRAARRHVLSHEVLAGLPVRVVTAPPARRARLARPENCSRSPALVVRRSSTDALASCDTVEGRGGSSLVPASSGGNKTGGRKLYTSERPEHHEARGQEGQEETGMSSPWKASPAFRHGITRVLWVCVILCMAGCAAADRPVSTPASLSQAGRYGPAERPAPDRILSRGEIQVAEAHLRDFGFEPGPVDGLFTAETQAAVQAFQARYGLPVSGLLDRETRRELLPGLDQRGFEL
jgi:hypothetical protein